MYDLHVSIANKQSTCVAPVGLVWDRVISLMPRLELHHADENHASNAGSFLTALVFYQTIAVILPTKSPSPVASILTGIHKTS